MKEDFVVEEINSAELKKIEFNILCDIADFCHQNNIRYYLCGGTLLGCIRHHGFIPWDDDIDIIMPRPDYTRFHLLYNQRQSNYRVHSLLTDSKWYSTFAEVEDIRTIKVYRGFRKRSLGISVDIFPIDGSPNGSKKRKWFWYTNNILTRIATLSRQKFILSRHFEDQKNKKKLRVLIRSIIKFIAIPFSWLFIPLNLNQVVTKRAMKYDVDSSEFIGVSTFPHYGYAECIHGAPFLKSKWRVFEGKYFCTPDNCHEYLSHLYGNYLEAPPIPNRKSHHDFLAYWKD